jgi:hypothetical protein
MPKLDTALSIVTGRGLDDHGSIPCTICRDQGHPGSGVQLPS